MPDTQGIKLPRDANGGIPKWVMYGGGIVAIIALITLVRKQQSGTTSVGAVGTSINAALGSVEEQLLNIQGDVSKANVGISQVQSQQVVDAANSAAYASQIYGNVSAQGTQAYDAIQGVGSNLSGQIAAGQEQTNAIGIQNYQQAAAAAAYGSIAAQATDPTATSQYQLLTTAGTGTH